MPPSQSNVTRCRLTETIFGGLLGALAGLLLDQLGVTDLLPSAAALPTLVNVSVVAGIITGYCRRADLVSYADVLLFAMYLAIGHSSAMFHLSAAWVRDDVLSAGAGAVVVLSSNVRSDSAIDEHALDRLLSGMELVKQQHIPRIVTSRFTGPFAGRRISSDADQRRVIRLVDSTVAWTIVDSVYSTRDEAVRMAQVLLPQGVRSIDVVTSPMHTRRACATFEAVGFTVGCHSAREHTNVAWRPETPTDRLAAFRQYIYERLGMVKYRAKGWVH
jgi:uncharacterized SAM-binding protein YcdF (DUF218 family)